MQVRFRPLRWDGPLTPVASRRSKWAFRASWSDTLGLLERELQQLSAHDVVIEADLAEGDIRLDGWPRANATFGPNPGVRVAFESKFGPLVYATDSCAFWQHNVRSIALGLEALRAVDRYGVSRRGEQYTGWKAIAAGPAAAAGFTTREQAWRYLCEISGDATPAPLIATDLPHVRTVVRRARVASHPDTGGNTDAWARVQAAAGLVSDAFKTNL